MAGRGTPAVAAPPAAVYNLASWGAPATTRLLLTRALAPAGPVPQAAPAALARRNAGAQAAMERVWQAAEAAPKLTTLRTWAAAVAAATSVAVAAAAPKRPPGMAVVAAAGRASGPA